MQIEIRLTRIQRPRRPKRARGGEKCTRQHEEDAEKRDPRKRGGYNARARWNRKRPRQPYAAERTTLRAV